MATEYLVILWGGKVLQGTVELSAVPNFIKAEVEAYVADSLHKNDDNSNNE